MSVFVLWWFGVCSLANVVLDATSDERRPGWRWFNAAVTVWVAAMFGWYLHGALA